MAIVISLFIPQSLLFYEPDTVDFSDLLAGLGYELHAHLLLSLQQLGRDGEGFVFELRYTVLACVVDTGEQLIVDKDIELMGFPLAYAPVFQAERKVGVSGSLPSRASRKNTSLVLPTCDRSVSMKWSASGCCSPGCTLSMVRASSA